MASPNLRNTFRNWYSPDVLTFLFTDLESSTRLWEEFPEAMRDAIERHDAILRTAVDAARGDVIKVTGDGLMAVFGSPADGVIGSLEGQRMLNEAPWGETGTLRVRMGLHVGEAQQRGDDFFGPSVNRAARIMAAAHGGQVLLSADVAKLADGRLPEGATLRDLGEHRLKDLSRPEHIFQLVHPALPADFPALATLSHRPNNLPTQTSDFFGRSAQLADLRELLDAERVRLVTLTGPGGIGKTRLALQAAANQIDRFEDGVFFVDLSSARQPDAVFATLVHDLGLTQQANAQPFEILRRELRGRHMLLVLDNFEQVVDAAEAVVELLLGCSLLKVLVTSREALRVRGEHLFPVPPLSLPAEYEVRTAASVAEAEAVLLFTERASEVDPSFVLTDDNAAAVVEICSRLDGLPLAIELAAARLRVFSPAELSQRLRGRLAVLGSGPRDLPVRQQTLQSTIEWSYELLDPGERALFELTSLFFPARVETVEGVAALIEPLKAVDIVDGLSSLVDKSLLRTLDGNRPRLEMFDTIREYAAGRRERDEELGERARKTHAEYFADFARNRRDRLTGPERDQALEELSAELGNLLAAWTHWVDAGDLVHLDELLDPLWTLLDARGRYDAAVELAADVLHVLASAPTTPDRRRDEIMLRTSLARGLMAIRGYTEEVDEAYSRALELSDAVGEVPRRFPVLRSLATFHLYRGEFDRAAEVGRELLELAEEDGDLGLQVEGHVVLGSSTAFLGDVSLGVDRLDRAIALFDPERHATSRFRVGTNPGVVANTTSALLRWLQGYPVRAAARATSGVELAQRLNHPFTLAYALFHVGLLDLWRRDFERARERSSGVLEVADQHGYEVWRALALALQGAAMAGLGDSTEGLARTDQGIALYHGLDTPPVFWPILYSVRADAAGHSGRPAEGLEGIDQAIELSGEENILYPEFAVLRGKLLLALGNAKTAEESFSDALAAASRFELRMPRLHAALSLSHIWRESDRQRDGAELLREAYESFTEGFDSLDLAEARTALSELGDRRA